MKKNQSSQPWVARLDRWSFFHRAVKALRIRQIFSATLSLIPLKRHLKSSGTHYEIRDLESFFLANEIFKEQVYDEIFAGEKIDSLIDLGCNVGYFICYAKHRLGKVNFKGLGVDANPYLIERAKRHVRLNQLEQVNIVHGLAGGEGKACTFFIYPSHLGSSQFSLFEPGKEPKGKWKEIKVSCLQVEEQWNARFGSESSVDLLKVDIEGSEGRFFEQEFSLLKRVKRLIVEWHKWIVKPEDYAELLNRAGFVKSRILTPGEWAEVILYERADTSS